MRRGHQCSECLYTVLVAALCLQSTVSGRLLQQYGGNTADQLVSDGSDATISQVSQLKEPLNCLNDPLKLKNQYLKREVCEQCLVPSIRVVCNMLDTQSDCRP